MNKNNIQYPKNQHPVVNFSASNDNYQVLVDYLQGSRSKSARRFLGHLLSRLHYRSEVTNYTPSGKKVTKKTPFVWMSRYTGAEICGYSRVESVSELTTKLVHMGLLVKKQLGMNQICSYALSPIWSDPTFAQQVSHLFSVLKRLSYELLLCSAGHLCEKKTWENFYREKTGKYQTVHLLYYMTFISLFVGRCDRARYARERLGGPESLAISWEYHGGSPDYQFQLNKSTTNAQVCLEKSTRPTPHPLNQKNKDHMKQLHDPLTDDLRLNEHGIRKAFLFHPEIVKEALSTVKGSTQKTRFGKSRLFFDTCVKLSKENNRRINWNEWYDYCKEAGVDARKVALVHAPRSYDQPLPDGFYRDIDWQSEADKYDYELKHNEKHLANLKKLGLEPKNIFRNAADRQAALKKLMNDPI